MKKQGINYLAALAGLLLTVAGICLVKLNILPAELTAVLPKALPYVLIGIGCGLFGHGTGNIIAYLTTRKDPEIQKQIEIEQKDERNLAIMNRAKAKAFDLLTFIFGALLLSFVLMDIDFKATLLFVFLYLFIEGYSIYYRLKYEKEM